MSPLDPLATARAAAGVVTDLMKAAGDNPDVKAAGTELGKAALTVAKAVNNALLPLAAVNFAFDKARKYFQEKFEQEIAQKAASIPPENIVEPKASIAGPALQGLAFAHEEPDLKEMYLGLLTSSMDSRVSENVHPAFVEIIRQLTAEEAYLLNYFFQRSSGLPIVELRVTQQPSGYRTLARHLTDTVDRESGEKTANPRLPAMIDNWRRLGLVEVNYLQFFVAENAYGWVLTRPEYAKLQQQHETETNKIEIQQGIMTSTAFGRQFASAVGIDAASAALGIDAAPDQGGES